MSTTQRRPQIIGIYTALISQAGTAAPTITVIKNTLPTTGTPVWTRENAGIYRFTSAVTGYFPLGLVSYWITMNSTNVLATMGIRHNSTEQMTIVTTGDAGLTLADSILSVTPIEIVIWDRLEDY